MPRWQNPDKADKLSREMVGKDPGKQDYGSDSMNLWYNELYPVYTKLRTRIMQKGAGFYG